MLQADEEHDVTPVLFNHNMCSKARRDKRRIVLPEGDDGPRTSAEHRTRCDHEVVWPEESAGEGVGGLNVPGRRQ